MRFLFSLGLFLFVTSCGPYYSCPGPNLELAKNPQVIAAFEEVKSLSGLNVDIRLCEHSKTFNLSPLSVKLNKDGTLIVSTPSDIADYMLSEDELRAVLGHELGHIYLAHVDPSKRFYGGETQQEIAADLFAASLTSPDAPRRALIKMRKYFERAGEMKPTDNNAAYDGRLKELQELLQSPPM